LTTPSFPPPLSRNRPSVVTKYAVAHVVVGIIFVILGAWSLSTGLSRAQYEWSIILGVIGMIFAIANFVWAFGLFEGKKWALFGYSRTSFFRRPDVIAFFGVTTMAFPPPPAPPSFIPPPPPVAPPPPPSVPTCPTCGQPLAYIQQYNRWYCSKCKKYV